MPLDDNLCSFTFSQLDADRSIVIIAEENRLEPTYYKRRIEAPGSNGQEPGAYKIEVSDPFSQAVYGDISSSSLYGANEVHMMLRQPDVPITLRSTGKVRFEWQFQYEAYTFCIRKDNILATSPANLTLEWHASKTQHKHDSSIAICHLSCRSKRFRLTMLDYNIDRIQIKDLKGFEVCILLCVLFIADLWYAEGSFFQLPNESDRLKPFRSAEEIVEADAKTNVALASKLREGSARPSTGRFTHLLRRRKSMATS